MSAWRNPCIFCDLKCKGELTIFGEFYIIRMLNMMNNILRTLNQSESGIGPEMVGINHDRYTAERYSK